MQEQEAAPIGQLQAVGQSVWIDDLTRDMLEEGELQRLVDLGITGVTANPTTFDKAVNGSHRYDQDIGSLDGRLTPRQIVWELLVRDVRAAADVLRPVYDRTDGTDGFVSIEVSPELAYDTHGTIESARDLWARVDRPNIFVKVPATEPGLQAIETLTAEGINVNVTLTFSLHRYRQVVDAYFNGLESRHAAGQPIDGVTSVASFFVSRVDAKVDPLLRAREAQGGADAEVARSLRGTIAIANAKHAYQEFRMLHGTTRWEHLRRKGAQPQRCLWASTSVKDPSYPATMYVEALAGPDTVDTVPPGLVPELAAADLSEPRLMQDAEAALADLEALARLGIDLDQITLELETEGVQAFSKSYHHLVGALSERVATVAEAAIDRDSEDSFPASDAPAWPGRVGGP
ncbi:MAG: transaldolase [Candidatus Dormibacteraeota bacterium]|nr:transaldolase [Candidatus Dormibacteraeota bacterium]MBO0759754.1 transaldolase [Candidatus Dormibacteraeota bacterium]